MKIKIKSLFNELAVKTSTLGRGIMTTNQCDMSNGFFELRREEASETTNEWFLKDETLDEIRAIDDNIRSYNVNFAQSAAVLSEK